MHTYTTQDFRNWVLSQKNELYTIEQLDNFSHSILLKAQNHTARVNFYPEDVTELVITNNSTEENEFYLHFQPKEKEHSEELFNEMVNALVNLTNVHGLTITLSCTSGLTTGFFTDKLNETIALMGMDYHFNAVPYTQLYERGKDSDMILLSPQISYEYKRISSIFPDKLIIKIPPAIFGGYKVSELISLITEEFKKHEERKTNPKEPVTIREVFNNDYRILTIGLINNEKNYRFPYRIYDHGKVTLDKEVIKTEYTLRDIDDLLDYIMVRHKNIDAIAIAMPGVTYHGILTNVDDPTPIEIPLGLDYTKKFNIPCLLCNDVNAMALGYYALNEDADNMLFYFQPDHFPIGGGGLIINGKLARGYKGYSGEIGPSMRWLFDDTSEKKRTPEGTLQLVTGALLMYISTTAPEKIILNSRLTPDVDEIYGELEKHMPKKYIPEITMVQDASTFMLPGLMIYGLDALKRKNTWGKD